MRTRESRASRARRAWKAAGISSSMLDSTACTESIALCSPAGVLPQSRWVIATCNWQQQQSPLKKLRMR